MEVRIQYAADNVYADTLAMEGETVQGESLDGDLVRLTSFAGAIPLVPGDVVTVTDGTLVGIHELANVWVFQVLTHTPDVNYVEGLDPANWDAAELAADDLEQAFQRLAPTHRDSNYGITVVTDSRLWFDGFVATRPTIQQVWALRKPGHTLDLAHELKHLGSDRIHQQGEL